MNWTLTNIAELEKSGKIRSYKAIAPKSKESAENKPVGGKAGKKSKYGNQRLVVDGIKFDSKKEMTRYFELLQLQNLGEISGLRRQVVYRLSVCKYIADHVYIDKVHGEIVEDVKSDATRKLPVYRLKKK